MIVYIGTFLIALSTLALEITLTRLLSVITWYHLAFFAIGTAMLGMTAGAITVYMKPGWFTEQRFNSDISNACLAYSLSIPVSLLILCLTPLHVSFSIMNVFALIEATVACALPFYFSGIAISAILTRHNYPIGKLYASDLIGASLGCLLVLFGLDYFDAPSLILVCAVIGISAALIFGRGNISSVRARVCWIFLIIILAVALINPGSMYGIRPYIVKGRLEDPSEQLLEKWNSFSRVVVSKQRDEEPQFWGKSPVFSDDRTAVQYGMSIDGGAYTTLRRFESIGDIEHLKYDITNAVYYLRPKGGACIIGIGGGRDIQSAVLFGHETVVGVDLNPVFVNLLRDQFGKFAGISDRTGVTLIVDEARSYLSRSTDKYSVIQMSMTDTFAATGAGAYSLSENGLYTVEGWKTFIEHLSDNGIFTVSRWHNPQNLGETGRVISLAMAALFASEVNSPSDHIAMIATDNLSTLLLCKNRFDSEDIKRIENYADDMGFRITALPGKNSPHEALRRMLSAASPEELDNAISDEILNYRPTTDENPYFFNMLRLSHPKSFNWPGPGVMRGNLAAHITLLGLIVSLMLVCVFAIVLPLLLRGRSKDSGPDNSTISWPAAAYFSLIGAGFMFAEIGLIQRLSIFLGHPIYALGILLFTIIASTGLGSFVSERLPFSRAPWMYVFPPAIFASLIAVRFALPAVAAIMSTSPLINRILVSVLIIAPLGLMLGLCFPTGMRMVRLGKSGQTPWYWALNGIFGVLSSALAVFIAIHAGIGMNFYIASVCYLALPLFLPRMYAEYKDS